MRKFVSLFITGLMALTMIAGVSAQNTGEANICIAPVEGGSIDVTIGSSVFATVPYSATSAQTEKADVVVTVTDTRGVVGGWNVTLSGTDFNTDPVTLPFDSESLVLTGSATVADPATGSFITTGQAVPTTDDDQAVTIITTGDPVGTSPSGGYDFNFEKSDLTVPAGTLVGDYKSTLTVTISAGDIVNPCAVEEVTEQHTGVIRIW